MLVLTRKTNQSIIIGDEIEVSILSVSGDKVRVGIAAPREIGVFRKEVYTALGEDLRGAEYNGSEPESESVGDVAPDRDTAD